MALVGSDAGGGLGDDLGPDQVQADLGGLAADGLAVVGATMVSLAVELGRAARLVGAGVGVELPVSEQSPRSRTTRVTRTRRAMLVLLGCWYMAFSCYLICWEKLAVIGGPWAGVALMVKVACPVWRSRLAAK